MSNTSDNASVGVKIEHAETDLTKGTITNTTVQRVDPVLAAKIWQTNADLIADVARLGYLHRYDIILDPTFGRGTWWKRWTPAPPGRLVAHDLNPRLSPTGESCDFRNLPYDRDTFDAVVLDGPYKLNGTSTVSVDERYGVECYASWQDRHTLIRDGMTECSRVLRGGGVLLVKCQDQVCSGRIRWQSDEFSAHGATLGLVKVDQFYFLGGGRPQPARSRMDGKVSGQQHAYGRPSCLLVFARDHTSI